MPGASNISKFLDDNSLRAIKTYVDGKSGSIPNEFIDSAFMGGPSIDYSEDFATLYPIPDTLSDTDGTHRVLFSETQLREVAGNSIAYNQNSKISRTPATIGGLTFATNDDGSLSISGTSTGEESISIGDFAEVSGHKFLAKTDFITGKPTASSGYWVKWKSVGYGKDYGDGIIFTANGTGNAKVIFTVDSANTVVNSKLLIQLFDLTLMGLDSVSTVEEAKSELLKRGIDIDQYNPYSEGEIRNTTASGVKVNGYNLLNLERTEGTLIGFSNTIKRNFDLNKYYVGLTRDGYYSKTNVSSFEISGNQVKLKSNQNGYGIAFPMKVEPGKSYTLSATVTSDTDGYNTGLGIGYYNSEGLNIGFTEIENQSAEKSKVFTTPSSCSLIVVVLYASTHINLTTFSNTCFHLSTLRTGYAPYKEPKAISFASTELLGAGEAHDTIEVVEGDKVAGIQRYNLVHVKRVGTVDLGTLPINSFIKGNESRWLIPVSAIAGIYRHTDNSKPANILCQKWITVNADSVSSSTGFNTIYIANGGTNIFIKDSTYDNMTIDQFKTAMNGVILNYELATPTRTTIAENLTFEEVSATIEQGGSIESVYETLAPNCTTGFAVDKDVIIQEGRYLDENGLYTLVSNISNRYALKSSIGGTITDTYINSLF